MSNNPGRFAAGPDARRHQFTPEECRRGGVAGYQATYLACGGDVKRWAKLYYKVRGWYRAKRRSNGRADKGGDR